MRWPFQMNHRLKTYLRRQQQREQQLLRQYRHSPQAPYVAAAIVMTGITLGSLREGPSRVLSQHFVLGIQISAALLAAVLGFLTSRRINAVNRSVWQNVQLTAAALKQDVWYFGLLVGVPYLVIAVCSAFFFHCRIFEGSVAFWVSVPPTVLTTLLGGYTLGRFTAKWRYFILWTALAVGILGLRDLFDVLYGYNGQPWYLLVGNFPSQRTGPLPNSFHLYSRALLLGLAALGYAWGHALYLLRQVGPRGLAQRLAALSGLTLLLLGIGWATQDFTGLGWSHHRITQYLSCTRDIEYLRIHYHPQNTITDATWRKITWDAHKVATRMGVTPHDKVDVYVFRNLDDLAAYTNSSSNSAFAGMFNRFYLPEWDLNDDTVPHELVHAIDHLYSYTAPLRIWPAIRLLIQRMRYSRAVVEGAAEAFAKGLTLAPEYHEEMAVLEKAGQLPDMQDLSFISDPEYLAYEASGSFTGFLVLTYGIEKYQQYYRTLDLKATYGASLKELSTRWKTFLRTVPMDSVAAQDIAKWYRGMTAYTAECCPQVKEREPTPEDAARNVEWWVAPDDAERVFRELRCKHPDTDEWQLKQILALVADGDIAAAKTNLAVFGCRDPQNQSAQYDAAQLAFFVRVVTDDQPGALAALQQILTLANDPESWAALSVQMLQHPVIGPAYFAILPLRPGDQRAALRNLPALEASFGPAYLYAFYTVNARTDFATKQQMLDNFVRQTAGFEKLKIRAALDWLDECLQLQRYTAAALAVTQLQTFKLSGKDYVELQDRTARLAFEQERFLPPPDFPYYRNRDLANIYYRLKDPDQYLRP